MNGQPNQKVSVEDLLRLKREERPAPEFWSRFDRELRAKQLAALVEKRPWWYRLPAWSLNWRRYHLPLGATAALALTLVSLRDGGAGLSSASVREERATASSATVRPTENVAVSVTAPVAVERVVVAPAPVDLAPHAVAPSVAAVEPAAIHESGLDAVEATTSVPAGATEALSARFTGGKVIAALDAEQTLGRSLGAAREVKAPAVRGASFEPLAQMSSPTEVRRARYRSAMAMPVAKETVAQANDRLARNLSDERMNDTLRRFDAKADRLSLKF